MKSVVLVAALLALAGWASDPGLTWADLHWWAGFDAIRSEGVVEGEHTCGDMAQEYRDYLKAMGIPPNRLRLVKTKLADGRRHLHLEVWQSERGEWRIYDPATGAFGWAGPYEDRVPYDEPLYGYARIVQINGYGHKGLRYHDGVWWPK